MQRQIPPGHAFSCAARSYFSCELLQGEASSGQHLVGAILSKKVAERHGLSTSIIPKGQVQERRQTEWLGRSLEFGQTDCKCNRLSECPRRCESSEQSNVWWHYSYASSPLLLVFHTELLGVLRVQPLPAAELHRVATSDAADGSSAEKVIQNIETNVPARGTPRDEASIDVVPQRQARAATKGFEFPPDILATPVVLKHLGSVGSRHSCFGNLRRGRSHRGELHRGSNRTQAPIGFKGSPLAQMRRVGKRLPDFFRRVAQFSDENERPLLSVLSYLRPAGRTRCVLLAIGHLLLLVFVFAFVRID